ncbi:hypothetical protein [uncultured Ferrimonas sp.]|uniref:hypothetical protein n=1 Tax=uncultured Ferrimonas sp. TaxID=432640 RepID=UPI0026239CF0|nr:hypothetical protein [uncultured Ferrimonas sp.]
MTLRFSAAVVAILLTGAAQAKVDGTIYASQGLAYTTDGYNIADREELESEFRELALNFNWRASPRWRVAGQGTWRQLGNLSDEDPAIDYLFAQYRYPVSNGQLNVLAGRYKSPIGWYNASRDSLFSRPSILLPNLYQEWNRDAVLRRDGLQIEGLHYFGEQSLNWNIGYGELDLSDNFDENVAGTTDGIDSDSDGALMITAEWYSQPWLQLKYTYSDSRLTIRNSNFFTTFGLPSLDYKGIRHLFSFRSEMGQWELVSEIDFQEFDIDYVDLGLSQSTDAISAYLQLRYLFSNEWQFISRYDEYYPDSDDRDGDNVAPPGRPFSAFTKTFTLGASWQFSNDWQLAAEWQNINGTANQPARVRNLDDQDKVNNLFMLQLAYRWNWSL